MKYLLTILILSSWMTCSKYKNSPWEEILKGTSKSFEKVLHNHDTYEVQILYTRIQENEAGETYFESHPFFLDTTRYFYPASTVKMPVACLALQKINELKAGLNPAIDKSSKLQILAQEKPQTPATQDSTSHTGYPTIEHYIRKIFAVSDNDAYNRLYEFLGPDYINQNLQDLGIFSNSRIRTRLGVTGYATEQNKYTNPLYILNEYGDTLYAQPENYAYHTAFDQLKKTSKGKGYFVDSTQQVVYEPFDMSEKNFINLRDLEETMKRVIYPDLFPKNEQFNLSSEDLAFLKDMMQRTPREHPYLQDDLDTYYDSYVKFFMYGDTKEPIPTNINIYNKVGFAYGYLTDCAYIQDTENEIEFFLTATIHVNENQIYNDGAYEYEEIGLPFLAELGTLVYQYERKQKEDE